MLRWNGATWESVPPSASMRVTGTSDSVTFAVSTTDIGGGSSFRFYVVAGTWNSTTETFDTRDEAPDTGWWSYDIAASTPPESGTTSAWVSAHPRRRRAPRSPGSHSSSVFPPSSSGRRRSSWSISRRVKRARTWWSAGSPLRAGSSRRGSRLPARHSNAAAPSGAVTSDSHSPFRVPPAGRSCGSPSGSRPPTGKTGKTLPPRRSRRSGRSDDEERAPLTSLKTHGHPRGSRQCGQPPRASSSRR